MANSTDGYEHIADLIVTKSEVRNQFVYGCRDCDYVSPFKKWKNVKKDVREHWESTHLVWPDAADEEVQMDNRDPHTTTIHFTSPRLDVDVDPWALLENLIENTIENKHARDTFIERLGDLQSDIINYGTAKKD